MGEIITGLNGKAVDLGAVADRIRKRNQKMVEGVIATGFDLLEAKALLGHGNFGDWLLSEFSWTERTARNFMSAAAALGANRKCISVLPLTTVYKLAAPSTPVEVRDQVVAELEAGQAVKPAEVEARILAARPVKIAAQDRRRWNDGCAHTKRNAKRAAVAKSDVQSAAKPIRPPGNALAEFKVAVDIWFAKMDAGAKQDAVAYVKAKVGEA